MPGNDRFEIRGINHLALVCKDMKKTVTSTPASSECR